MSTNAHREQCQLSPPMGSHEMCRDAQYETYDLWGAPDKRFNESDSHVGGISIRRRFGCQRNTDNRRMGFHDATEYLSSLYQSAKDTKKCMRPKWKKANRTIAGIRIIRSYGRIKVQGCGIGARFIRLFPSYPNDISGSLIRIITKIHPRKNWFIDQG